MSGKKNKKIIQGGTGCDETLQRHLFELKVAETSIKVNFDCIFTSSDFRTHSYPLNQSHLASGIRVKYSHDSP